MVLETSIEPIVEPQLSNATNTWDDEPELLIETTTSGSVLFDKVYTLMESFASTQIGQFVLERGDRLLNIFEDTVKWSLPQDKTEASLVRPLPWLPFLALIILFRQFRIWLSLCALLIGNGPITPNSVIYFIQTRRRKLRSIRLHGLKTIKQREHLRKLQNSGQIGGLMVKLGQLLTIAICRPRSYYERTEKIYAVHSTGLSESFRGNKRLREDDCPEAEMNCHQLLSQYANDNSDDDSDYMPIEEEEETNESTLSFNTSNDTQGENSMDTSGENAKDLDPNKKVESKGTKSPVEKKKPTIDINDMAADKSSDTKNPKYNEQKPAASVKSGNSVTISAKLPNTPQENGSKKERDELGGAAAVVQTHEVSKSQKENIFNLLNGHADVEKKATPGHSTAAVTKPHAAPLLLSNALNATPNDGFVLDAVDDCLAKQIEIPTNVPQSIPLQIPLHPALSSFSSINPDPIAPNDGFLVDAVDDCSVKQIEIPIPLQPALTTLSSSSCSTPSSTSSLGSFETSNDYNDTEDDRSDPPTPTPSLKTASSTEDIFLSPFGSPPNFNTFHNPLPAQQKPIATFGAKEDHAVTEDGMPLQNTKQLKSPPELKTEHQHKQQKQSQHQRYRRNRY